MAVLFGEFDTRLDSKNRVAIASSIREQISPDEDGRDFIMILGPDRHVWLYPELYYRRLLSTMKRTPLPTRESTSLSLFFGMASPAKPDPQGRVVIPPKLRARARLTEEVTVVCNNDHLEVWPREDWDTRVQDGLESYGDMLFQAADRLAESMNGPQDVRP